VALLAEFGAVAGDPGKPLITALGRWAAGHLAAGLPGLADPGQPASEMIAEAATFGHEEQQDHVAWGWLAERQPAEAAREILTAAEGMSPLLRGVAIGVVQRLGEEALPAWRELTAALIRHDHATSGIMWMIFVSLVVRLVLGADHGEQVDTGRLPLDGHAGAEIAEEPAQVVG